ILWWRRSVEWQENVSLRQSGVSQRVIRIACNRLLIKSDRLSEIFAATFAPERSAFQIKLVCGQVACRLGRYHLLLLTGQLRLQRFGDRCRDVAFDCENISQFAVVSVRPELGTGLRVDQLHIDPHLIGRFLDATLKNVRYAELLRDLGEITR